MTTREPTEAVAIRLFLIASGLTAIAALVVAVARYAPRRSEAQPVASIAETWRPGQPIGAEAGPFRTTARMLAIDPESVLHRAAHPRTAATFQALRSYPGAPPRIPHGLTQQEVQSGTCKTCHERGGFSPRFGAYVPVTPHPEMGACLQCHVGDAKLMAISLPNSDPSARCKQCHAAGGPTGWSDSTIDWKRPAWPTLPPVTKGMDPPAIPHDLEMRSNCLTCHGAPAAMNAIRTSHPERADCRQCHLTVAAEVGAFTRRARGRLP